MSDNEDINRQIRSNYSRGNMLIRNFRSCTIEVKIKLFKTYMYNMYCSSLWCDFSKSIFNKLKVSYNNVFRIFLNYHRCSSASEMFVTNNTRSFNEMVRNIYCTIERRLTLSSNVLVQRWCTSVYPIKSSLIKL